MQKIIMPTEETKNFLEVFELFVISQSAKGVADVTIRNYKYHMKNIGNYMNLDRPFDDVAKRDIENMVAALKISDCARPLFSSHSLLILYQKFRIFSNCDRCQICCRRCVSKANPPQKGRA